MNLRDLIFSQPSQPQPSQSSLFGNVEDLWSITNSPSPSTHQQSEKNLLSESDDSEDDIEEGEEEGERNELHDATSVKRVRRNNNTYDHVLSMISLCDTCIQASTSEISWSVS